MQKSREEPQRHRDTERKRELPCRDLLRVLLRVFVSLWRIVFLRKTGAVVRFCDHGRAADFYKRGICRGIWVKIVLDFWFGAVGFLINGAQRAVRAR